MMLSLSEETILQRFRQYHMTPNKMLCFFGQDLQAKADALDSLVDKKLLVRESYKGAYSLTHEGYAEMHRPE